MPSLTVLIFYRVRLLNVVLRVVSVLGGLTLPGLMMTIRQISLRSRPPSPHLYKGAKEESDWYSTQSADVGKRLS